MEAPGEAQRRYDTLMGRRRLRTMKQVAKALDDMLFQPSIRAACLSEPSLGAVAAVLTTRAIPPIHDGEPLEALT